MNRLYHYTCAHGRAAIGLRGLAMPVRMHDPAAAERMAARHPELGWLVDVVWFTDQYPADPHALGLTRDLIACDRTAYCYQVLDADHVHRWLDMRASWPAGVWKLHQAPLRPAHWWVSSAPVPVALRYPNGALS